MIENIELRNFRGFKHLTLENLRPLTLLSGKNNVGKSSILESVFLYFDHTAPESFGKINNFRKLPVFSEASALWDPVFYNLNVKDGMRISLKIDGIQSDLDYTMDTSFIPTDISDTPQEVFNQFISSAKTSYTLKFTYSFGNYRENGHFTASPSGILRNIETSEQGNFIKDMPFTQFISSAVIRNDNIIAEWIGRLELKNEKHKLINALRILDPAISDVSIIAKNNQIQLYVKIGSQLLPFGLAGDGLNRLLFIVLAIISNSNSVILIDEIDSGFHYSMHAKLWKVIANTARENNCQIIASTHSYECIVGAVEGIEQKDDFCYYRISRDGEKILTHRYSDELLNAAISIDMEVR